METTRWTPGPWRAVASRGLGTSDRTTVGAENFGAVATTSGCRPTLVENQANARLIAAAPELVAMVKRLVPLVGKALADKAYVGIAVPLEPQHALDAAHALLARLNT